MRNRRDREAFGSVYGQVSFATVGEEQYKTGCTETERTHPTCEEEAQETARRNSAERNNQCCLFGCLGRGGYKLFSAPWDQTQKIIKTNKNPPNPNKAVRRNARSLTEHTDPDRGELWSLCTQLPPTDASNYASSGHLPCIQPVFPSLSPYFLLQGKSLLPSVKEVLLVMMAKGVTRNFWNTDSLPSKPCMGWSSRQPDGAMN